jgi:cytoskeletal protein RodZ
MEEKYTVELVSPVTPDMFDKTVAKVATVIKKDVATVSKLLGRGPGKLTKGTSKQKADAFARRLSQTGLDVVVLGEGEIRPAPRATGGATPAVTSSAANNDATSVNNAATSSPSIQEASAGLAAGAGSSLSDRASASAARAEETVAEAGSAFSQAGDAFTNNQADPVTDNSFSDSEFSNDNFDDDNFDNDFDSTNVDNASNNFDSFDDDTSASVESTSTSSASSFDDDFDDDFDRDAFDDPGFSTEIRNKVSGSAALKNDQQADTAQSKKADKNRSKQTSKGRKSGSQRSLASTLGLFLVFLVVAALAALYLLPAQYTAFVPESVRTSVNRAPETVSSFFVSLPSRVSGLWGGSDTSPATTNTADTTDDNAADDNAADGDADTAILTVPAIDDTDTADATADVVADSAADTVADTAQDATTEPADTAVAATPNENTTNAVQDVSDVGVSDTGVSDAIVEVTPERIFATASSGTVEEINALAQAGADFNIRDDFGQTPIIYALGNGQDVIQALITQGANVNIQTNAGWTPLMYAGRDAGGNIISVLLQAGADTTVINNDGQTALQIAQATPGREGATEIIANP